MFLRELPPAADYIIVGAGAAGCILARSLLQRELGSVLLLESGLLPVSRTTKIPAQYPRAFSGPHAWSHLSVPQTSLAGRRIPLPAGKAMGGSTAINAMIYLRGHPKDFLSWESKLGSDWSYDQVFRAYQSMEKELGIDQLEAPELHSVLQDFSDACRLLGFSQSNQMVQPALGIGPYKRLQLRGRRLSAWQLGIQSLPGRLLSRLSVCMENSVQQIVFTSGRAVGVLVTKGTSQSTEHIRANRGVIVCAGAIRSPQLLMQSGIGDGQDLKRLGIPLVLELPQVGKNMQDHMVYPVIRQLRNRHGLPCQPSDADRIQYVQHRTGNLASNIAELGGFFALEQVSIGGSKYLPDLSLPDFQWHVTPTHYLEYPWRESAGPSLSVGVTLLRPTSRGTIRLMPNEASQSGSRWAVEIDPQYLTTDYDSCKFHEAIAWTRSVLERPEFAELLGQESMPGHKRQSHHQISASIQRFATTLYHYAGTCPMGSLSSGVVDSRFRVHGTERLWVCDASALPSIVSANTQATVMMMAYRLGSWMGDP